MQQTLAQLRRRAQQFLLDDYDILAATRSLNSYGRESYVYAITGTTKGQLSAVTGAERKLLDATIDGGVSRLETARLALPYGTALNPGQYVRKDGSEKVWNVALVTADETLGALTIALLTREANADE